MTDPTPPPGGQPQALTDDEHERMIEFRTVWYGHATENDPSEESRLICRYCWHEGPDGKPRHQDWPCEVVRIRGALDEARARAAHFEALAKDQQATNAAMVASLQRGLAELKASEAEVARLREAMTEAMQRANRWGVDNFLVSNSVRYVIQPVRAALAAMDRGRAPAGEHEPACLLGKYAYAGCTCGPAGEAAEGEAPAWAAEYVAEHPKERESRCRCKGCQGPPFCRCCNGMLGSSDFPDDMLNDAPPAPADQARREGPDDGK